MGALACSPCNYVDKQASVLRLLEGHTHFDPGLVSWPWIPFCFLDLYILIMDGITIMIKNKWQEYCAKKS